MYCVVILFVKKSFISVIKKVNDEYDNLLLTRKAYIPIIIEVEIRGLINLMNDKVLIS
jgi:hypothetical protein